MTRTRHPFDVVHISRPAALAAACLLAVACGNKAADKPPPDNSSAPATAAPKDNPPPKDDKPKDPKAATPHEAKAPSKDSPAPPAEGKPGAPPTPNPPGAPAGDAMRWEVFKAGNLKFEIPSAWTSKTEANNHLVVQPPGKNALVEYAAVSNGFAAKAAEKELLAEIGKIIQAVKKTSNVKKFKQHGCDAFTLEGKGKKDNAEVDWVSFGVGHKGGEILAIALFYKDVPQNIKDDIRKSLESIQPGT
jgi:hypothetical protein